ncbi:PAS domain-containing protein [Rhodoferax sp. AJA081-3]|uniref:sensor histidine kinase n=1 Tax=Rhodoferax sp. AJA081-3 TaxID=2752316 RepID=UPI001ADFE333|nr:ATP-binding protein [Rhodoferax sp. AJA081-3]QTN26800.1 PAS domain-containing protein [Rhodoferax sp. AJA081-3]
MHPDTSQLSSELKRQLASIRAELANRLVRGVFWIGMLVVPLSLSRTLATGWLPIYTLHLAVGALYLALTVFRRWLPTWLKAGAVVATLYLVGVAGVLSLGLAAPSLWWLMGSLIVANVLLPARGAQAMLLAAALAMVAAAVGFTTGWLEISVDLNAYVREPTAWATLLLGTGGFVAVVFQAVAVYNRSVSVAVEHAMLQWVDGMPLGVLVLDGDGKVHYGNRRLEEVLGVDLVDLGQHLSIHAPVNVFDTIGGNVAGTGKRFPAGLHPLFRAMHGEESNVEDLEIMVRGEPRRFRVTGRPVRNADGELVYSVGTFEDITERKRAEIDLQRTRERADSASRAKGQLLAHMSREMRTPIDTQLGLLQLLRQSGLNARQLEYVTRMDAVSRNLLATVNDVLDYSESASGKLVLVPGLFHIDLVLAELQQRLLDQIGDKPITVNTVCDPQIPTTLYGDDTRLLQVLGNLGDNAVKFTASGTVAVEVLLKETDVDSVLLEFTVRDTGIGIAPRDRHRVFSGFFQADTPEVQRLGGAGVGLAVSDRLVRLMGSSIAVSSTLGQGSVFSFPLRVQLTAQEQDHPLYPDMPDEA